MGFCLGRGSCKPWGILASCPQGYQTILEHLLQRLTLHQQARSPEPGHRGEISALIATRAIHELLLEPSRRMEVQTLFPPLLMALLFHASFLVVEEAAARVQDHLRVTEWMDPVRYLWPPARVAGDLGAHPLSTHIPSLPCHQICSPHHMSQVLGDFSEDGFFNSGVLG